MDLVSPILDSPLIQRALYPRPEGRGFTARWVTIEKCSQEFNERNFAPVEYTDAKGEKRPMYLLSKDGFMMVAMAYITPEAMRIKEAYIARFNEMEEQLRTTSPLLPNFRDPIAAAEAWIVASDVAKALGYANPQEATREHCRKVNKITQPSESLPSVKCPPTFINIIPESDVYRLVMRSNLPKAGERRVRVSRAGYQ